MIFTVVTINKDLDMYTVISDTNEKRVVSANQILGVILGGYTFTNVCLTSKGFGIATDRGTRYIQVKMDRGTQAKVDSVLRQRELAEEMKKRQMTQAIRRPVQNNTTQQKPSVQARPKAKAVAVASKDNQNKIQSKAKKSASILFRGDTFVNDISLCKKYNVDINKFRKLRDKGYAIDESLGLKELRSEAQLIEDNRRAASMLYSLDKQRGDI